MGGTYAVTMGDRGRLVLPVELRQRLGLDSGSHVLLVETAHGVVMTTREQARQLLQQQLAGADLVQELLRDRRAEAAADAG